MNTQSNGVALLLDSTQLSELISTAVKKGINETDKAKEELDKLYTINEVAKRIGKAHRTVKTMVKNGTIKTTKDGKISELAIREYLKNNY